MGLGCDVAPPLGFKYSKRESNTNGHHPHKSKNTNDHFHLVACSQWMEEDIKPNITTSLLEDQIESCVSLWRPITHIQTIPRTARTRGTTLWYQTGQCRNKTTTSQPAHCCQSHWQNDDSWCVHSGLGFCPLAWLLLVTTNPSHPPH